MRRARGAKDGASRTPRLAGRRAQSARAASRGGQRRPRKTRPPSRQGLRIRTRAFAWKIRRNPMAMRHLANLRAAHLSAAHPSEMGRPETRPAPRLTLKGRLRSTKRRHARANAQPEVLHNLCLCHQSCLEMRRNDPQWVALPDNGVRMIQIESRIGQNRALALRTGGQMEATAALRPPAGRLFGSTRARKMRPARKQGAARPPPG